MEIFANEGGGNLDGAVLSGATTLTIKSAVNVPAAGTFRARIESEYVKVTGVSGLVWTVARGDGGTTAAAHADGVPVYIVVTKEALDAIVTVQSAGTAVSNRRVLNFVGAAVADDAANGRANVTLTPAPVDEAVYTPPPATGTLTWVNQGGATVTTNSYGGWFLNAPAVAASDNNRMLVAAAPGTTPWALVCRVAVLSLNVNFVTGGLVVRESGTGKFYRLGWGTGGITIDHWSGVSAFVANDFGSDTVPFGTPICWGKIAYDGTNITFYVSHDGLNWLLLKSVGKTAYFATGPDTVGVVANANQASGGLACGLSVLSWTLG